MKNSLVICFKGKSYVFSQKKASATGYFWTRIFQISKLNRFFFHHYWAKSENSKITQIYFSWTINDPIFSEIGEKNKIVQNSIEKKTCEIFWQKKKIFFVDLYGNELQHTKFWAKSVTMLSKKCNTWHETTPHDFFTCFFQFLPLQRRRRQRRRPWEGLGVS